MTPKQNCEVFKRIIRGEPYAAVGRDFNLSAARIAQIFFKIGRTLKHPHLMTSDVDRQKSSGCHSVAAYRLNSDFWLLRLEEYERVTYTREDKAPVKHQPSGKVTLTEDVIGYRAICYIEDSNFKVVSLFTAPIKAKREDAVTSAANMRRRHGDNYIYGIQTVTVTVPEPLFQE